MTVAGFRRVFSGIQPTGILHLGNYFGAVKQWKKLQDESLDASSTSSGGKPSVLPPLFSIVDLHAITLPQDPSELRLSAKRMTATLLACGIDQESSIIFRQSDVAEHASLEWVLGCLATLPRLSQLPQFKEKSERLKEVPLGLYVYPVLQSADILLYKATHVPVGEDNLQNVYFAQHIARVFNHRYKTEYFSKVKSLVLDDGAERIRSLRNPEKKMSKSDVDEKSRINITDSPDVVVEKCKKAVTDFTSAVTYDPIARPGVSNLVLLHSLCAGISIGEAVKQSEGIETAKYKLVVAEAINEHMKPIRTEYEALMKDFGYLKAVLDEGADKARGIASNTWREVREITGLSF